MGWEKCTNSKGMDYKLTIIGIQCVVAGLYEKAQQCEVPGARPAGLRGHPGPRATRSRPRNDFRNKPLTGYRNKYISQNFMIRGIFTERKEIV